MVYKIYLSYLQWALVIHKFCINEFNQQQIEKIEENYCFYNEYSQTFDCHYSINNTMWNDLHSVYIVLGFISNLEMIKDVGRCKYFIFKDYCFVL